MDTRFEQGIAEIRSDRSSGATAIVVRAVGLLTAAAAEGRPTLESVARELCAAQPCMAGLRSAASVAMRSTDPAGELEQFARRVARAPAAIARQTAALLALRPPARPSSDTAAAELRLVTCSSSAAVEATLRQAARIGPLRVCCAESRPSLEGRGLASRLAAEGLTVVLVTDAALSAVVEGADAILVGADAVGPAHFINKVGTGALCARGAVAGIAVYVLAGKEKCLSGAGFDALSFPDHSTAEVWPQAPPEVSLLNPYFERIPLSLVTTVVTDGGPIDPVDISAILKAV